MNHENELSLSLRRDRGYVYFPDAIEGCLRAFSRPGSWSGLRAECYKTTDRRLVAELSHSSVFDAREPDVFARVFWNEEGREAQVVLRETEAPNPARYDLSEPAFSFKIHGARLLATVDANAFASHFHRWAVLCKKLYHHSDPGEKKRMLLQRMVTLESPTASGVIGETVELDFMTKDRFMKFSVWNGEQRAAEVIAAAQIFD